MGLLLRVHGLSAALAPSRHDAAKKIVPRSMRAMDVIVASLLLALGVLVLGAAVKMGIGWGSDGPEGGFVPFWLAVVLVLACLLIIVRAARKPAGRVFATREQLTCVAKVLLPAAAMIVVTPFMGLYVAAALYMGFYMRWGGRHRWLTSLLVPVVFSVLTFLIFEWWFLVPLPKGPLEAWLGY